MGLGRALFHRSHSFMGFGLGLKDTHILHWCRRLAMHHRAFVARGIERHIKLFGESGGDKPAEAPAMRNFFMGILLMTLEVSQDENSTPTARPKGPSCSIAFSLPRRYECVECRRPFHHLDLTQLNSHRPSPAWRRTHKGQDCTPRDPHIDHSPGPKGRIESHLPLTAPQPRLCFDCCRTVGHFGVPPLGSWVGGDHFECLRAPVPRR